MRRPTSLSGQAEHVAETGYRAAEWVQVGSMQALNGICEAPEHVFVARGLTSSEATGHHEEGITEVRAVPFPEVLAMVGRGEITDGETIAALMYAAIHLGRVHRLQLLGWAGDACSRPPPSALARCARSRSRQPHPAGSEQASPALDRRLGQRPSRGANTVRATASLCLDRTYSSAQACRSG
jgi:hypothetical protein